jgi:hypothetical protein
MAAGLPGSRFLTIRISKKLQRRVDSKDRVLPLKSRHVDVDAMIRAGVADLQLDAFKALVIDADDMVVDIRVDDVGARRRFDLETWPPQRITVPKRRGILPRAL